MPVNTVEDAILAYLGTHQLDPDFTDRIETDLELALALEQAAVKQLHSDLTRELSRLDANENRLLDAVEDQTMPTEKIRERLNGIQHKRRSIHERLADT